MNGKKARFLRQLSITFKEAGHPVSYHKLKTKWVSTGRDKRHPMIENLMRQAQIYIAK